MVYLSKVWSLYWRVSIIHPSLIILVFAASYFVSPLVPGAEQPEAYDLFLVFIFFSIIFIPANILWSFIVAAFYKRFYMTAGIVFSVLFQVILFVGITLPFESGSWEKINFLDPSVIILLSYGFVLLLSFYLSLKSVVPYFSKLEDRGGRAELPSDWNSVDN